MDFAKPILQRPTLWFWVAGATLLAVSAFFFRNVEQFSASDRMIWHTHRVIVSITRAVSSLREAEAVQRGYLISGENSYLLPYSTIVQSVHQNWDELKRLTVDDTAQQQRIARLEPLITEKLADLDLTIKVRREQDFAAAQRLVMNNYGKDVMDIIRAEVDTMLAEEAKLMAQRNADAEVAHRTSVATILMFLASGLLLILISMHLMRARTQAQLATAEEQKCHDAELEEKIMLRTAQVRQLASHLELVREEEKRAIARELHDDIGSSMTALSMLLEGHFRLNADNPSVAKSAEKVRALLKEVTQSTRRIQAGLRPNTLDTLGLIAAINELVDTFSQRSGVKADLLLPKDNGLIPDLLQVPLFRMLQESLNNVAKHAQANHVIVTLATEAQHVLLQIEDDGIGITRERARNAQTHGLLGIRERTAYLDGTAEITSQTGRGTVVTIRLPLEGACRNSYLTSLKQIEAK